MGGAAAAALVYWALSLEDGHGWLRSAIKGLAVAPLAAMALVQGAPLVALALALCSLGDVILSRTGQGAFLGGLIAFTVGHLAWIAVFIVDVSLEPAVLGTPLRLVLLGGLTILTIFMCRILLPNAGALRIPVAVYLGIIVTMVICALATPSSMIVLGAVAFAASDSLLGVQTFVLTRRTNRERVVNAVIWPMYWGAVALLTIGALA